MQFSYCTAVTAGSGEKAHIHLILYKSTCEVDWSASCCRQFTAGKN